MIKILVSAMLFLMSINSHSQQTKTERKFTQEDYLKQSRKQKTAAFVALAAGTTLIIVAAVIPKGELVSDGICVGALCSDKYKNDGIKTAFFIAGGVVALGSIPLFIVSGKNRRKANSVSFKMENIIQPYNQDIVYTSFPAIRVKFSL